MDRQLYLDGLVGENRKSNMPSSTKQVCIILLNIIIHTNNFLIIGFVIIFTIMVTITMTHLGRAEVMSEKTYPDPGDVYMREPFMVHFKVGISFQDVKSWEYQSWDPRCEGFRTWKSWSCLVCTRNQPQPSLRLMLLLTSLPGLRRSTKTLCLISLL